MKIDGYNDDDIKSSLRWILGEHLDFAQPALEDLSDYCKRVRCASYAKGRSDTNLLLLIRLVKELVTIEDHSLIGKGTLLINLMRNLIGEIDNEN